MVACIEKLIGCAWLSIIVAHRTSVVMMYFMRCVLRFLLDGFDIRFSYIKPRYKAISFEVALIQKFKFVYTFDNSKCLDGSMYQFYLV